MCFRNDFKLSEHTGPVTGDVRVLCSCIGQAPGPYIYYIYSISLSTRLVLCQKFRMFFLTLGAKVIRCTHEYVASVGRVSCCESVSRISKAHSNNSSSSSGTQETQYMNYLCNKLISWKQSAASITGDVAVASESVSYRKCQTKMFRHTLRAWSTHTHKHIKESEMYSGCRWVRLVYTVVFSTSYWPLLFRCVRYFFFILLKFFSSSSFFHFLDRPISLFILFRHYWGR